jgi:hypothetical protein
MNELRNEAQVPTEFRIGAAYTFSLDETNLILPVA